jgi:hypothetical protein
MQKAPEKLQFPSSKNPAAMIWKLALAISLELGAWNLDV